MNVTRREALGIGALTVVAAGCAPVARRFARDLPKHVGLPEKPAPTFRLVNRTSFGPTPGELQRVAGMGPARYVEEQLAAGQDEPLELTLQLGRLDVLRTDSMELGDIPQEEVIRQLQQAALLRATYSPNQLRERMVEFWTNHFNIYARKELGAYRKGADDAKVIRDHALGTFPDLLKASARSPAMLAYLDNQLNVSGVPNENYARELMELHTLGVHGGYSQKDVAEVARCFTGWGIENRFLHARGTFFFDLERHDRAPKSVLGHRIDSGDERDAEQVLDILAKHPGTAEFIAAKLVRHFVGDGHAALVAKVAATYSATGGDIKPMLRAVLLSRELLVAEPLAKRPFEFVVSSLRALNARTDGGRAVQEHLDKMGQPLYQWPMPDGYPERTSAWTSSLLARWNFAIALAEGRVAGTEIDLEDLLERSEGAAHEKLAACVLGRKDGSVVRALAKQGGDVKRLAALCLAGPEFQWR